MKHVIKFLFVFLAIQACSNNSSRELISIERNNFTEKKPMGMVLVSRGSFAMGSPSDTSKWGTMNKTKQVSIESFWMDEVMVTNKMYKEFVIWVADSVFRSTLDETMQKRNASGGWAKSLNREQQKEREAYLFVNAGTNDGVSMNSDLVNYAYGWFDYNTASMAMYSLDINKRNTNTDVKQVINRRNVYDKDSAFINESGQIVNVTKRVEVKSTRDFMHTKIVRVYPDTACWINDFKNSQMKDYAKNYFRSSAYNNYPVVGVSWDQANAFCNWRTFILLNASKNKSSLISEFRLPTEAEWEFAARSRGQESLYPWENDETFHKSKKGVEFYANFKSAEGNFSQDGFIILSPVGSFKPNELGVYDLAGNAAEWTSTAYFESGSSDAISLNPNVSFNALQSDPYFLKRKVVRGGSFKDSKDFINPDLRTFEYQNNNRSYIGFRCVRSKMGY